MLETRESTATPQSETERNWLLKALPERAYQELAPLLKTVTLTAGQRLGPKYEDIPFVYFPQSGVVSILRTMRDGAEVEVGTIGSEGMTALAVFLGGDMMPTQCVVQIAGTAKRIRAQDLQDASREEKPLRDVLLCYTQYLFDQVVLSVACNKLHSLEQRYACWMLMTRDRVGNDSFLMTHEHLADLLGVRRAGISEVAKTLSRAGGIQYTRGRIEITDAGKLEAMSCECYRNTHEDFDRLLGKAGLGSARRPE